jgi:alpha-tubulin suppressor-like RCC1 family protein
MTPGWKRWICFLWMSLISVSGNAAAPMITAAGSASRFLNSDGSVWGTGSITNFNPGATSPVPSRIGVPGVVAITTIGSASFALLADGTVWGAGANNFGQLGDGTIQARAGPQQVPGLSGIKAIAGSSSGHVLALKDDGTVWAWGQNDQGQLGDGTRIERHSPVAVLGLTNITRISSSGTGSLALRSDGTVWVWGLTYGSALGNGVSNTSILPGDPGWNQLIPSRVLLDQAVAISAGSVHHMALRADGTVWTWGYASNGENGTGRLGGQSQPLPLPVSSLDHVVAIANEGSEIAGFSLALKADGTVWSWGINNYGQLGVSGIAASALPIQVPGVANVVGIAAGAAHVLAMRGDGTVLAWGSNSNGQLGDNSLDDRAQARPVVGPGGSGQLNLLQAAPANFNQLPQAQISLNVTSGTAPLTVQAVATNATDPDGTVRAIYWKSSNGQQATGTSTSFVFSQAGTYTIDLLVEDNAGGRGGTRQQVVVAPVVAAAVSVNPKLTITGGYPAALTNDGRVLMWGGGPLGLYASLVQGPVPTKVSHPVANGITGAVDVAVGSYHALALLADGTALGWGGNNLGQTGTGRLETLIGQPVQIANLPPAQALAAGGTNSFALTRDGRVFAWGSNSGGELGLGDNNTRYQPAEIPGLANVIAIVATDSSFAAALKGDGTVWAWGYNGSYRLGDGTTISRNRPVQMRGLAGITRIFVTMNNIFALKADGTAWVSGTFPVTIPGDPGPNAGPRRLSLFDGAAHIAGSYWDFAVVKPDGTLWVGGQHNSLALGLHVSTDIAGLQQLPGITDAMAVTAGGNIYMVLRRDGTALSWGINDSGGLGNGTLAYQQTPALVINETINGPLDLIPEVPNTIPPNLIPPFFLATYADGGLSSTTLYADLRGIIPSGTFASASDFGRFAAGYNVYVAAGIPLGETPLYFQLDSNNSWSALRWPMAEFLRSVALESQNTLVRAQILQNADLSSPQLAGASIIVGYGTDPDEMLRSGRLRVIFTVPQP